MKPGTYVIIGFAVLYTQYLVAKATVKWMFNKKTFRETLEDELG